MWHVWETREVYAGFWWEDPRERDHLEVLGVYGRTVCKRIFKKWDAEALTGLIWLRKETDGGAFGFHKMWGISWLAEDLLASQEASYHKILTYLQAHISQSPDKF